MSEVDEIFAKFSNQCVQAVRSNRSIINNSEAKAQLLALIEKEVIGEDEKLEPPDPHWPGSVESGINRIIGAANNLRAEQRNKLRTLFGGEDD